MKINRWVNSIASAGKELLRTANKAHSDRQLKSIDAVCEALYSNKGEALGTALAEEVSSRYIGFNQEEKIQFFHLLAEKYNSDPQEISNCTREFLEKGDNHSFRALTQAVEAPRQQLIRRINMAPSGTRTLVNMRSDLLRALKSEPSLQAVDDDLRHLLSSWFNPGFLTLERIDWSTPALVLEKLIEYEAVHEMTGWDDLRRRLDDVDRRCFGFFHPALPDEPLIFVEVALMGNIASSVQSILAPREIQANEESQSTAIFYSISNCQKGLKGISFGNFLIKQVVMRLKEELPELKQFATLSPIPGFHSWLMKITQNTSSSFLTEEERGTLAFLQNENCRFSIDSEPKLAPLLQQLCAHYLINEKRGMHPLDSVARFHLGNGASIARLNWLGDTSERGLAQSMGMLVNYQYDLGTVEKNHEKLFNSGEIAASKSVIALCSSLRKDTKKEL